MEIDIWNGRREHSEPLVTHGHTLCTTVPLGEVLQAIAEVAFEKTRLPLILSLEVCLPPASIGPRVAHIASHRSGACRFTFR